MEYGKVTLNRIEAVWNKLGGEDGVHRFLSGLTEVVPMERIIDCDGNGKISHFPWWEVEEHRKLGELIWDASRIRLYMSRKQKLVAGIQGNDLRIELQSKLPLNSNVLEYLMENKHLIPLEWKDTNVYFWGTVYRYQSTHDPDDPRNGDLFVQYLTWVLGWCTALPSCSCYSEKVMNVCFLLVHASHARGLFLSPSLYWRIYGKNYF